VFLLPQTNPTLPSFSLQKDPFLRILGGIWHPSSIRFYDRKSLIEGFSAAQHLLLVTELYQAARPQAQARSAFLIRKVFASISTAQGALLSERNHPAKSLRTVFVKQSEIVYIPTVAT